MTHTYRFVVEADLQTFDDRVREIFDEANRCLADLQVGAVLTCRGWIATGEFTSRDLLGPKTLRVIADELTREARDVFPNAGTLVKIEAV